MVSEIKRTCLNRAVALCLQPYVCNLRQRSLPQKAVFLADEFWSCYDAAASSEPFLTSRSHYDLEKLLRAHCDLHLYCAYPQARKRGEFLVDFAYCNLTCDNLFGDNSTEWYTLTESFWDAYDILGIPDAIKLAERFAYREFWDLFYKDADPFPDVPKLDFIRNTAMPTAMSIPLTAVQEAMK